MKTIFVINGSASEGAANLGLLRYIASQMEEDFLFDFAESLKTLPHFDPALSVGDAVPPAVVSFREKIAAADGVLIGTPEYVFSIPSGLKNLIEWCVATTVFSNKPVALITASASGQKGHEELQMLMRTLGAKFIPETTLLISGIKAKMDSDGALKGKADREALRAFLRAFGALVEEPPTG